MKTTIIGIAGGTGSGKSTFTNRLKKHFGDDVTVIYHDNYYRPHDDLSFQERQHINYDHPKSLETDLLIEQLTELRQGRSVECPVYDFAQHTRAKETTIIKPSRVIIVEGILILQDERLRDLFDIKIFVEADADERILRRVLRDINERGRDLENIIEQYLETVKPMHYLYVAPTKNVADIVINSGLNNIAFDIIKVKIQELLKENNQEDTEA